MQAELISAELVSNVKAVIAAGGIKSRTIDPVRISKALFPIMNKPAYMYTLQTLKEVGVTEAYLTVGDNEIESDLLIEGLDGFAVHTVTEEYPRGTAGCLKPVEEQLRGNTIILIAAGLVFLTPEDLREMISSHRQSGADLTIGLMKIGEKEPESECVLLNEANEIEEVVHVHSSMDRRSNQRTSGIYVLEQKVLEHINPTGFMDMKEQLFPKLRRQGMKITGYTHKQHRASVRSIGDYLRMNFELLRDRTRARFHLKDYREVKDQVWVGKNVHIEPSATLIRPLVIGDETRIDENVTIVGPAVIGPRCELRRDSFIRESIFWPDSSISSNHEVDKCLISGKAFNLDGGYCRESIILDGEPFLDGIGAALGGTSVGKIVRKKTNGRNVLRDSLYAGAKRTIDLVIATTALLMSLPLWALIAVMIKMDSRGGVFFTQVRCGKNGRPFRMIKFRTMVRNAEELKPHIQHLNESDGPMFKIFDDPRETRVGRFLRKTNLDELPQLINVMRGNMSIVGPRPLSMNEMRFNPHWRDARLHVQQGMTGLWQVKGRESHFFHDWIKYDLQYVDECSFLLDLKIIFLTLLKSLKIL